MSLAETDHPREPRTLRETLAKFHTLLTREDRGQWWRLLLTALIAGAT